MAIYSPERKWVKTFSQTSSNGRERVDWRVSEHWVDIDEGTVARCGAEATCTLERSSGISEKSMSTLKEVAGGTLGLKDVWSLKAEVESVLGREVSWHVSSKSTKTFKLPPTPKCGRYGLSIYQMVRTYEITLLRKRWFASDADRWKTTSVRTIEERTNNHDALPDVAEFDPVCNCKPAEPEPTFDGMLAIDLGTVSLRVPYRSTPQGMAVQVDRRVINIDMIDGPWRGLRQRMDIELGAEHLPEPLRFLGGIEPGQVLKGHMARYFDREDFEQPLWAEGDPVKATAPELSDPLAGSMASE